tara:strand:+ start:28771 stop:29646 length:876 start_codon:yes stop_codon:yes gene_type:complete
MKKNILIIGGDSYIASNFINSFQTDFYFKVISRKKTPYPNEFIIKDLFEIPNNFFVGMDVIMNFCAIVHKKEKDSLYKKINFELPVFLFEKSKKFRIKHFIQMSTISVYERSNNINLNSKENPANSYGYYKLKTDNFLLNSTDKNINVSCIRSPMVYGANAPGNMKRLITLASINFPLPFKNIDNKLTFINIKNLIHFLNIVINKELFGILIPTDKQLTSTKEIIKIVRKILGRKERLVIMPNYLKLVIKILYPNIYNKLFESLVIECNIKNSAYKPNYTLFQGLRDYLKK